MTVVNDFSDLDQDTICSDFASTGRVIAPVENVEGLDEIRCLVADASARHLGVECPSDHGHFLDQIHNHVGVDILNDLRLACINAIRQSAWFRPTYYSLAKDAISKIVGNELAMQKGIGLSVQLPEDDSSLLPIHADTWDGDSEYEVVLWLPLVDCFETKSMYMLPLSVDRDIQSQLSDGRYQSAEKMFEAVSDKVEYLKINYGSFLLFSQTIAHGNRINIEATTRWSMNCRFKSVLSPYADKKIGEFFQPISIRPATRMGMDYKLPGSFDE